ncbi:MAG: DUF6101 family protein [Janthinobacterium lividum]
MSNAAAGIKARIADGAESRFTGFTSPEIFQAGDSRADDRCRSVFLARDRITIDRSYHGIAMRLSVPVSAYRGVCVGVRAGENGGFVYELRLTHRDPDLSVLLAEAQDESQIWAEWRASARFFDLPALIERNDGPEVWGASLTVSDSHDRRVKHRRRPGIVARRTARPEAMETVYCEDEIIARD